MADIDVGKLKLTADTSGINEMKEKLADLKEGIPSTGQLLDKFVESLKNIPGPVGVAVVGLGALGAAMMEVVSHTLEVNQHLLELSEATGISVEQLQPLAAGMELAGVSSDKLGMAVGKLSQAVGQALSEPTGKAAAAFKQLGISQAELKSGDTEQIMKDAAAGFDQYGDSIQKTAAERELFGRQGPQIVAALQEEAKFSALVTQTQKDYGTAITEADAKSDRYFTSTLKLGLTMFEGVAQSVTKSLLPGLQELVNQFMESGKQGGVMRDILDGLSATITTVSKVILSGLYEPISLVVLIFKEAGTAIGASMAAIAEAAKGNFSGASAIIKGLGTDLQKMEADSKESSDKFETALWGTTEATKAQGEAVDANKPKFQEFSAAAQKVAEELTKLRAELQAQLSIQAAAAQGLEAYKQAQDGVAIAALKTQLAQEGATKAQIAQAVATKLASDASKQITDQEVAGWNLINKLKTDNLALTTRQTQLDKELADIAANPGMTEAEKAQATALANTNEKLREQAAVMGIVEQFKATATKSTQSEIAGLTMSANELKLYNAQMQLAAQYQKDIVNKTPEQITEIATAYGQAAQQLALNNDEMVKFQQSSAGALAGAQQGMKNFADSAQNANQIANNLTTQFENGFAQAFVNFANGGKDAFKQFALEALKQIELVIAKLLVMQAIKAASTFLAAGGTTGGYNGPSTTPGYSAAGNAFQYAASGIVTSATMVNPSTIAGEQGNSTGEAVLPLVRTASGQLGVNTAGGGGSSGSVTNQHVYQINVNAQGNQNPQAVAQAVANQIKQIQAVAKSTIADNLRSGGMLNQGRVQAY